MKILQHPVLMKDMTWLREAVLLAQATKLSITLGMLFADIFISLLDLDISRLTFR